MGSKRSKALLGALVMVGATSVLAASSASASASVTGTCGMTVDHSLRLGNDLSCSGTALSISSDSGAPPITVDLGGHTVATTSATSPAIIVSNSVTLRRGTVRGGDVVVIGGFNDIFEKLVVDGVGIRSALDSGQIVRNNRFVHGGHVFTDNDTPIDISGNDFVNGPSTTTAIAVFSTTAMIVDNKITGYGTGITVTDVQSAANIDDNVIRGAGTGIFVTTGAGSIPGTITNNRVSDSAADGIHLGVGSALNVFNNEASHNGADGIHFDPTATGGAAVFLQGSVTANEASRNANWGIEAPASDPAGGIAVSDGYGNVATGNGQAQQCLNVVCSGS